MERLQLYLDWYHKENERQQTLNEAISIPTGIVTAISVVYYFQLIEFQFSFSEHRISSWIFIIFSFISILFWLIVVYWLFKSYNDCLKGYTYKQIEFPINLNAYFKSLEEYANELEMKYNEKYSVQDNFDTFLLNHISKILDHNIAVNDKKSFSIHLAKKWLLICLSFLFLSFLPFMFIKMNTKDEPTKIEITNSNYNIMSQEKIQRPPEPKPPQPREIKEDKRPTPPPTPPKIQTK